MPHGTPDWGLVGPKKTVFGLDDLGEHAVRGGSPHLWDRRGDVIWQTIFANGLEGCVLGTGMAGDAAHLFTGYARQGAFCVELVELGEEKHQAYVSKAVPLPVRSRLGMEATFHTDIRTGYAEVWLMGSDGAISWNAAIRYSPQTGDMDYLSGVDAWTNFGSAAFLANTMGLAHTLKMVMDYQTQEYVRAILDDTEWNITGNPIVDIGVVAATYLEGSARAHAIFTVPPAPPNTTYVYVDSLIITQNEP